MLMTRAVMVLYLSALSPGFQELTDEELAVNAVKTQFREERPDIRLDTPEGRALCEHWLDVFTDMARQHGPDSGVARAVRGEMIILSSWLGRYADSIKLLEMELALATRDDIRAGHLDQIGLMARSGCIGPDGIDKAMARKSINSFRAARELYRKLGNHGACVGTLSSEAQMEKIGFRNHKRAADLEMQAYDLLPKVTEPRQLEHLGKRGLCPEHLLSTAALDYARAGEPALAVAAFKKLEGVPEKRLSRGVYLRGMLSDGGAEHCDVTCPFVETWIAQHPDNEHTPHLMYGLGLTYSSTGMEGQEEAKIWFERFLDEYIDAGSAEPHEIEIRETYRSLANLYRYPDLDPDPARAAEMQARLVKLDEKREASKQPRD